jgi:hypothetical protein
VRQEFDISGRCQNAAIETRALDHVPHTESTNRDEVAVPTWDLARRFDKRRKQLFLLRLKVHSGRPSTPGVIADEPPARVRDVPATGARAASRRFYEATRSRILRPGRNGLLVDLIYITDCHFNLTLGHGAIFKQLRQQCNL